MSCSCITGGCLVPEWVWLQVPVELKLSYGQPVQLRFLPILRPNLFRVNYFQILEFVCLQVSQILYQNACLLMQRWHSHLKTCARTHYTHWMVAEVLKIWCCVCIRQIDWQVSVSDIFALSPSPPWLGLEAVRGQLQHSSGNGLFHRLRP